MMPNEETVFSQFKDKKFFLILFVSLTTVCILYNVVVARNGGIIVDRIGSSVSSILIRRPTSRQTDKEVHETTRRGRQKRVILFWVPFYQNRYYGFGQGSQPFVDHRCLETNCETTTDRSRLMEADAVVFHIRNIVRKSATNSLVPGYDMPRAKPAHQRWVFFLYEPPPYAGLDTRILNGWFNWTMTYRKDSDFPGPYGLTERRSLDDRQSSPRRARTSGGPSIVWMVSHCQTSSQREDYVRRLQRYVAVDVYGACGPLRCSRSVEKDCYEMISKKYKFYLSFENSLCRDYITEKLWKILMYTDLVPIVYGGGDYDADAPPDSFIDARKFTPQQLAAYVRLLDKNATLYERYRRWRKDYRIRLGKDGSQNKFCKLCAALNNETLVPSWYDDMWEYWTNKKCGE